MLRREGLVAAATRCKIIGGRVVGSGCHPKDFVLNSGVSRGRGPFDTECAVSAGCNVVDR